MLAVTFLAGCSSLRLAYDNAPRLAWWWLDGYVDFSREQAPAVQQALDELLGWHRATQLPAYAALLAGLGPRVREPITPAAMCRLQGELRAALEPTLQRALGLAAAQLPGLGEAQFRHIELHQAKLRDELRKDYLQVEREQRLERSAERVVERAERLYGRLDAQQRRLVQQGVQESPFDPALWIQERERRQQQALAVMRRLVQEGADAARRLAALRELAVQAEGSSDPAYRAYQARLADYNCAFGARIHNTTTTAQRARAAEALKGWEADLRALAAAD